MVLSEHHVGDNPDSNQHNPREVSKCKMEPQESSNSVSEHVPSQLLDGSRTSNLRKDKTYQFQVPSPGSFYYSVNFFLTRPEVFWAGVYTSYIVPGSFKYNDEQNSGLPDGFNEELFVRLLVQKDLPFFLTGVVKTVRLERALVLDNAAGDVIVFEEVWDIFNNTIQFSPKYRTELQSQEASYSRCVPLWIMQIHFVQLNRHHFNYAAELTTFSLLHDEDLHELFAGKIEGLVKRIFEHDTEASWNKKNSSFPSHPTLLQIDRTNYLSSYKRLKLNTYRELKQVWNQWEKKTDPQKYIPEDLHIATYLTCLQSTDKNFLTFGKKFVDIGCGNGLLTHLLTELDWKGYGIDLRKRKLWDHFIEKGSRFQRYTVKYNTLLEAVDSETILIGNHPDELARLIPLLAIQTGAAGFILIPCCAYDFCGQKFVRPNTLHSVYDHHLSALTQICLSLGFEVKLDKLRIPSTKRMAILGKTPNPVSISVDARQYFNGIMKTISEFKTESPSIRDLELRVNNCSQLPRDQCENIMERLFAYILNVTCNTCDSCVQPVQVGLSQYHTGCHSITLAMLSGVLNSEDRKLIKNQGNGIRTLLRNYSDTFCVRGSLVTIQLPSRYRLKDAVAKGYHHKLRSRPCFFYQHHPDGCPLEDDECAFSHA